MAARTTPRSHHRRRFLAAIAATLALAATLAIVAADDPTPAQAAGALPTCPTDGSASPPCLHAPTDDPDEYEQWRSPGSASAPQVDSYNDFRLHRTTITPLFEQPQCASDLSYTEGQPAVSEMPCASRALVRSYGDVPTPNALGGRALDCVQACPLDFSPGATTDDVTVVTNVVWEQWTREPNTGTDPVVYETIQHEISYDVAMSLGTVAPTTPPVALLDITATGKPNEYRFNADRSYSTVVHSPAVVATYELSDGYKTAAIVPYGTTLVHQFADDGPHSVKLTIEDARLTATTIERIVDDHLSVDGVFLQPVSPPPNSDATATVVVTNDGIGRITGVTPTLTADPSTRVVPQGAPSPASANLDPGQTQVFTYQIETGDIGPVTLKGNASGTGSTNGTHTVTATERSTDFDIGKADLVVDLKTVPSTPRTGVPFKLVATVTNGSGAPLFDVAPTSLAADPPTGVDLGSPTPASVGVLANGDSTTFEWPVSLAEAVASTTVTAAFTATNSDGDEKAGQGEKALEPTTGVTVNDDGDDAIDPDALTDSVCDVDPDTDGEQCTLRAAIELTNQLGGRQTISFDIGGGGTPIIRPATDLPATEAETTIDGTTQPGGWVALNGSGDGESPSVGIELGGNDGTLRGFVIGGFTWGANVKEGTGHRIVGNRIGTSIDGTSKVPNQYGIGVQSDATIGGTRTVGACVGDCNVISGNTDTGIVVASPGTTTITGNVIGVDATGTAALANGDGIALWSGDTRAATRLQIGGRTGFAGAGLGNVISGNTHASIDLHGLGQATISGNLIGPAADGNGLPVGWAPADDLNGIEVSVPGPTLIGGPTVEDGNVISGFLGDQLDQSTSDNRAGIMVFGGEVEVRRNRIGTERTGTRRLSNSFGIATSDRKVNLGIEVRENLISGSTFWGVAGAGFVRGNYIGTNAAGTTAIPNRGGVHLSGEIGGLRGTDQTDCTDPCNLISGNDIWATVTSKLIQGNFVGTDITGTQALPNGRSFDPSKPDDFGDALLGAETVGGSSAAMEGTCDRACNLVAGNVGPAVSGDTIQGNVIGLGIDGRPLGNYDGIRTYASGSFVVGGPGDLGNVITNSRHLALGTVQVSASTIFDRFELQGNTIAHNAGGINPGGAFPVRPANGPHVTSAIRTGTSTEVVGTVDNVSAGLGQRRVDLYASERCEVSGQADRPVGSATLSSLGGGAFTITTDVPTRYRFLRLYAVVDGYTFYGDCIALGGARTATTASSAAGDAQLQVASTDGFAPGDYVQVDPDEGGDVRRIAPGSSPSAVRSATPGTLTFDAPLSQAYPAGTPIERLDGPPGDDAAPPTVTISSPTPGQVVDQGASLALTYACADAGVGLDEDGCTSAVASGGALDTSTPGSYTATVRTWDRNGNVDEAIATYTVQAPTTTTSTTTSTTSTTAPPSSTSTAPETGSTTQVAPTTPTTTDVGVDDGTLPRTGSDVGDLVPAALALLGAGVAVLAGRRRALRYR